LGLPEISRELPLPLQKGTNLDNYKNRMFFVFFFTCEEKFINIMEIFVFLHRAVDLDLVPGRSPISVAAAAIYMAAQVHILIKIP
jgi:transcription initiation factor TFIIIB Brf1 subunit/transcription initiation factor TFIIB